MNENKVKQLALRVDRELVRKLNEIDIYLSAQSLYVRRSLSATIRFCVENQWLAMGSLFADQKPKDTVPPPAVGGVNEPMPKKAKHTKKLTYKKSNKTKTAERRANRRLSNLSLG
jgi:hypothetical protein